MEPGDLDKINAAHQRYALFERVLDRCRLPGALLGAAAGVALVVFAAAPVLGLEHFAINQNQRGFTDGP
jgi:hypothetical protein